MLNLLGCSKDNFKKLIQKMGYKTHEKNNETYFQYNPKKEYVKKVFKKDNKKDNPFKILKNINFN
jgi:ATP-dependent RNA helicase SUPV3L1/SUV3